MQYSVLLMFTCLQSVDSLRLVAVATHLRRSKPEIREVPFHPGRLLPCFSFSVSHSGDVYTKDLSSGSKDANAETKTVRAAMLSGSYTFGGRREFYVLRRLLLDYITSDSSAIVADIPWIRHSYTFPRQPTPSESI